MKHELYQTDNHTYILGQALEERNVTLVSEPLIPFTDHVSERLSIEVSPRQLVQRAVSQFQMPYFWLLNEPQAHDYWQWMKNTYVPHKIAVFNECVRVAADMDMDHRDKSTFLARAVVHDLSKLGHDEIEGYMSFTRNDRKTEWAIESHYRHNAHHPEYWIVKGWPLEMPRLYVLEMVADWAAASTTYGTPLQEWVDANFNKKPLHPSTRELAKEVLDRVYRVEVKD